MNYCPDEWVLLKIEDTYKIFASWRGGFATGDSWRLNSGVIKIEEDENTYTFFGNSGSKYICHKSGYGIKSPYNAKILNSILYDYSTDVELLKQIPESIN